MPTNYLQQVLAFPHLGSMPNPADFFFAADSTITNPAETLLSGFRKIYPVSVKLWEPDFARGMFRDYSAVYQETEIALGFAGSTLTAQLLPKWHN